MTQAPASTYDSNTQARFNNSGNPVSAMNMDDMANIESLTRRPTHTVVERPLNYPWDPRTSINNDSVEAKIRSSDIYHDSEALCIWLEGCTTPIILDKQSISMRPHVETHQTPLPTRKHLQRGHTSSCHGLLYKFVTSYTIRLRLLTEITSKCTPLLPWAHQLIGFGPHYEDLCNTGIYRSTFGDARE